MAASDGPVGQHSLPLFCFGVFLSFGAHWILVQYSHGVWAQLLVSFAHPDMIALAWFLDRARKVPNLVRRYERVRDAEGGDRVRESVIALALRGSGCCVRY